MTKTNKWNQIFDFTKREDENLNYKLIDKDNFKVNSLEELFPDIEIEVQNDLENKDFIFDIPINYGGNLDSSLI